MEQEVAVVLKEMVSKKKNYLDVNEAAESAPAILKIVLSDREFGK